MLDIKLLPNKKSLIYISQSPITVNRVGDIATLSKIEPENGQLMGRPPWEFVFIAEVYSTSYRPKYKEYNTINMRIDQWDSDKLPKLSNQNFSVSILQNDEKGKFIACVCQECNIDHSKNIFSQLDIAFRVTKSEMVYDQ